MKARKVVLHCVGLSSLIVLAGASSVVEAAPVTGKIVGRWATCSIWLERIG
jgi:hypothetical protein